MRLQSAVDCRRVYTIIPLLKLLSSVTISSRAHAPHQHKVQVEAIGLSVPARNACGKGQIDKVLVHRVPADAGIA